MALVGEFPLFGSVLRVRFNALTLMVGGKGHLARENLCHLSREVFPK